MEVESPQQGVERHSGHRHGHDPDLCHREPYDFEKEKSRREEVGMRRAAWDRIMAKRGPRPDYGGTWVAMDGTGVRIVGVDPGRTRVETTAGTLATTGGSTSTPEERRDRPAGSEEVFEEVIQPRQSTKADREAQQDKRTFELLMAGTPEGLQLGVWEIEGTTMEEFLRLPPFQKEFLSGGIKNEVNRPPHQNTRKDTWVDVKTNAEGKRVAIREHPNSRRQKYDFTGDRLWEETWSQWRLTIAWAAVGKKKMVICDLREGCRSTHLPVGRHIYPTAGRGTPFL